MPAKALDPTTIQLATRIPKGMHRAVKIDALESGVTLEVWIREALEAELARRTARKRVTGADQNAPHRA